MSLYVHPETQKVISISDAVTLMGIKHPPGWLERRSEPELTALGFFAYTQPPRPTVVTDQMVMDERDRRMRGTFIFQGKPYDCDSASLQRITGASVLAMRWLDNGGDPTSVYWNGGETPFQWIAADNSLTELDAKTMFDFGRAAIENESAHIFASRALKDMAPIPTDYTDDKYWP